ncbi:MAG: M24 family metallopeptidase [Rhizobiaceae bacterium]
MVHAQLKPVSLPDFGMPDKMPELDGAIFLGRFDRLLRRVTEAGHDALVLYADREHAANLSWLTGFDPRFEEALLIVVPGKTPVLFTGPENQGTAGASPLGPDVRLYPPMGLLGQDRSKTPPLAEMLAGAGIASGMRLAVAGWKYFGPSEAEEPGSWLEIPSYLADALRGLVGPAGSVTNAGPMLMDPESGLRSQLELEELARMEFAACHTSEALKRVVRGARPGMREFEAASLLQPIGLPLSCHPMFSTGKRAWFGLLSPTSKVIERGEAVTAAYGVQGALNCRAGWLAQSADDLPAAARDYVDRLVAPYFEAVAGWLEQIRIGARGGDIYASIMDRLGEPFFGVGLNPGHLIHLDEWMHSPIAPGSRARLRSGMALQVDVIPATGGPCFTTNMEDGVALLDERARSEFAERWPQAWSRISARRAFMDDKLGIHLHEDVLPLSNTASWLPPFWLSSGMAMTLK